MKKLVKILLLLFVIGGIIYVSNDVKSIFARGTDRDFGELIVDFHVPKGRPIFKLYDLKPGDEVKRKIDVKNKGKAPRKVFVSGLRRGGIGLDPKIETSLEMVIKDGSTILYGPKKLTEFFTDSQNGDGIRLDRIKPKKHKTYTFKVRFPILSGNEFQKKSVIFDLRFLGT